LTNTGGSLLAELDLKKLRIDFRQLAFMATIADCRSISGAALRLGIAQPSLSEAVARLERDFGFQLIVRTPRGIEFTESGAALAKLGHSVLDEVTSELVNIELMGKQDGGLVTICIPPAFSITLGVQLAETIKLQHPNIQLCINEATSLMTQNGIERGDFDLAIIYHGTARNDFVVHPLMEEEFFLAVAPDNWEQVETRDGIAVEPLRFKQLAEMPLVLPKRPNGLRNIMEGNAKKAGFNLNVVFEIDSLYNMIAMVTRASAYAIVPQAVALREVQNGEVILIPIIDPKIVGTSHIIRKAGRPISRASLSIERLIHVILKEQISRYSLRATLIGEQAAK
jgi:LysR family nitrogen assimilation transcriptional regulator